MTARVWRRPTAIETRLWFRGVVLDGEKKDWPKRKPGLLGIIE
jgi:hypothetical protein